MYIGDVLKVGQKLYAEEYDAELEILKINTENSTIAGYYSLPHGTMREKFEFRGLFDPKGITVGWTVSYWSESENYHSAGVWSGYLIAFSGRPGYAIKTTYLITHESDKSTTTGSMVFELKEE